MSITSEEARNVVVRGRLTHLPTSANITGNRLMSWAQVISANPRHHRVLVRAPRACRPFEAWLRGAIETLVDYSTPNSTYLC